MPLHTRAKSCDHEIVRAQWEVSKGRHTTPPNHVLWSRILKCSVKPYVTGCLKQMLVQQASIYVGPPHMRKWYKSTVVSVRSAMVSQWFRVRPTSKRRFLKIVQVTVKHDLFDAR